MKEKPFEGWVYIMEAMDGRWNITLPTFRTKEEALEYTKPKGYRLVRVREVEEEL